MYALVKTLRKLAMAIAPNGAAVKKQGSLAALVWVMALAAPQLHAQVNKLTATVKYDGTPGFDIANDGAGYDSSATNNRVRTHDLFGYEVGISTNASGADSNIRIKAKLPDASKAQWRNVPAACNAGSQVSSDRTELTCVIAAIGADTARNVVFDGVVVGTAPNGAKIEPTFTLESNGNGTTVLNPAPLPAGQSRELTVSAAPFYDVVVQMSHDGNPNAFGMRPANGPAGEDGVFHKPLVGLVARHPNGWGNKGVEQLSDVPGKQPVIRVDFSGYPSGTLLDNWHNGTAPHGVPAATGGFAQGCGSPYKGSPSAESGGAFNMYKRVNDRGEPLAPGDLHYANTVVNGGTCHIQSYAGTEVAIRLEGVDTTLARHISKAGGGFDVPAAEWWVSNKGLVLWTPVNTTNYPADTLIPHKIKLLGYTGKSISDQDILGNRTDNDEATHNVINRLGGSVSKAYSPDSKIEGGGSDRLDPPYGTVRDPTWTSDQIVSYLAMGQSVSARVIYSTNEAFAPHRNVFTCEIIDRTAFDIQLGAGTAERPVFKVGTVKRGTEGGSEPIIRYGSRNAGPYFSDTSSSNSPYSDGSPTGSSYDDDDCDHAGITWHTTPEAAEAAGGLVYVRADYDMIPPGAVRYLFVRGLILRDKWAASIAVNNGTQDTRSAGQPIYNPLTHDPDVLNKRVIIRNRAKGYNPDPKASHINNARPRDHLEVIPSKTQSSVKKTVKRGTQDLNDNDDVGLGDELTYTLKPRYHTDYPRIQGTYVVEDRLPPHLEFVAGSEAVSGLQPNVNVAFTHGPDPVNAGFTILKWVFTGSGVKAAQGAANPLADFATITFNARVSISAPDGAVLRNNVLAGDEVNDYGPKCSFNATVPRYQQMVGGSATDCDKASNVQLKVKVLSSYAVEKTASPAVIRPGDSFKYTITYQAGNVPAVAPGIPHWIDVLPYSGDGSRGRSPATSIANADAYKLQAVTNLSTTADPGMQIYLTKDAPASISGDPRDSGNSLADGSVNPARWCLMGSCAFPIAETTAIRIAPGVNTMPVGVQYKVEMTLTTDATKVDPADYYANSVTGHPPASTLNLHLVSSLGNVGVKVISNSLSGKVYWKQTIAGVEQAGEYPIANNEVKLVGCAAGPDGVVNTTAAASGALVCSGDDVAHEQTVQTNSSGEYSFANIPRGRYHVNQSSDDALKPYRNGVTTVGTDAGGTATDEATVPSQIRNVLFDSATSIAATGYNFGERANIEAKNDNLGEVTAGVESTTTKSVVNDDNGSGRDQANGVDAVAGGGTLNVTVTPDTTNAGVPVPAGFTLNTDGTITVASTVPAGTHEYPYSICLTPVTDPATCHSAVATIVVKAKADVRLSKTVDKTDVSVGDEVTFTITVTNDGPSTAEGVSVNEQLPSGYSFVSATESMGNYTAPTWTVGNLANGASARLTLKATVNASGDYANTATVSTTTPGDEPSNNSGTATVTPTQKVELVVTKVVNNASPKIGENVEFTITVTNNGPSTAEAVKLEELMPDGYSLVSATPDSGSWSAPFWTIGDMLKGQTVSMKVVATVLMGSNYVNVVKVSTLTGNLSAASVLEADAQVMPQPATTPQLVVEKRGSVSDAEVGDVVLYTIRIRNTSQVAAALQPVLVDRLPAGFLLVGETVAVRGANLVALQGAPGSELRMQLDAIPADAEVMVQYRVRLGVGAQQGDGINRAHMECPVAQTGLAICSNEDQWQVKPRGGVFSNEGCVVGQIYVDANGNSVKDREELGIPGVRMYFQDGTYMISDVEGKYSYCGLRPVTHVLKVDSSTLPRGSRLMTSSSRNAGDANSLFIDLKAGELHRADFIEGSASNEVLEQVKARRANGEVRSVESEAGQPALKFESKPAPQGNPLQQGTDSANQLIERARQTGGQ